MDYADPRKGLSGAYTLYKASKGKTYEQVKRMLEQQEGYQLHRQKKDVFFPIIGRGPGSYQADLMFLDEYKKFKAILCIINVNTRVAYGYALKTKEGIDEKLEEWLEQMKKDKLQVNYIQTDKGSEFVNKDVRGVLDKWGIEHDTVNVGDHSAQGKVERFNQTLRRLITIYQDANKTRDWVSPLNDLLYNYNHRFHSSLGGAPVNASESNEYYKALARIAVAKKEFLTYKKGDKVRVLLDKERFDKGRKTWSPEIHTIEDIKGHRLKISDIPGWKKHYDLQKVEGDVVKASERAPINKEARRKDKKVVRTLKKEGVSKEEGLGDERLIGRTIRRKVDGKFYNAKIVSFKEPYYKALYEEASPKIFEEFTSWQVERYSV